MELYTDGACSGNPGPGGWAFILRHHGLDTSREDAGGDPDTTNNRMELTAVIRGLESLTESCQVDLYSDSQYVVKGLTEWIDGWKEAGWRRGRQRLKNLELWKKLDILRHRHDLRCHWVRGHDDHPENERCDELAVAAAERAKVDSFDDGE